MQIKKLALFCAVACASMAGTAQAAMTSDQQSVISSALLGDDGVTGDVAKDADQRVIFISGASAVQKGFTGIISTMFTGTPIYFSNTSVAGASRDYEGVAGTLAAGTGAWAGKTAIFVYRVKGGSVYGVNSVARQDLIDSLNVTTTCGINGDGSAATPFDCGTVKRKPDAGVSDVAPAMFQSPINTESAIGDEPNGVPALTEVELATLTATPIYGLAFGVPVTKNVGLVDLNKAAVSAIMAGGVGTWDKVDPSLPADDVVICRRVPGSGTQAVENLYFGGYPCSESLFNVPADRYSSAAWNEGTRSYTIGANTGGVVVVENSTSGDVVNCLEKAVSGGSYTTKDRAGVTGVTVNFVGAGHKAIGVLSMDSLSKSKTTGNWQFRSLDGAGTITWDNTNDPVATSGTGKFPTKASFTNGVWDMQGWVSFNLPSVTTGPKLEVLNAFVTNAQSPDILSNVTDLKNVAGAMPFTADANSTGNVLRAGYLNNNQCGPLNRYQ